MSSTRIKLTEGIAVPFAEIGILEFLFRFVKFPGGQLPGGNVQPGTQPVAGTNNDYDSKKGGILRLNPVAANADLSGILAPVNRWKILIVQNISAFNITLLDQNAGSQVANRFNMGGNYVLQAKRNVMLLYDPALLAWTVFGNEATFVS